MALRPLPIPRPMLSRPGSLPQGEGWAFELKWDGFRAIVSTENGLRVRSRRGWNMTTQVPELAALPKGLVLDGEPVTFVSFDVLRVDGHNVACNQWSDRRALLEELWVERPGARLADVFDDGHALFDAVVRHGLEGVVAKRRNGIYRPGYRGWTKVKNPSYWQRDDEREAVARSRERNRALRLRAS